MGKLHFGRYDYACFGAFSAYAACSLVIPIVLVSMARELNFPLETGGMASGGTLHLVRSAAMVLSLFSCGMLAGRIGKRLSMGFAMFAMGAGIFLCTFACQYAMLLPFLSLAGLGEGVCEGLSTPFVHDLHKDAPGGYVNIAHSFWSVGTALCVTVVGSLLALGINWRLIMAGLGILTAASSLCFLLPENPQQRYPEESAQTSPAGVWEKTRCIIRAPRFWVYCLGMFLGAGAEFGLTFWSASFIQLNFNATALTGGLGTASLAFGMFLGRSMYGRFVPQRYLVRLLLTTGLCGIPVTSLMLFLRVDSFGSPRLALAALFLLLFLAGLCVAPYWPSLQVYGVDRLPHLDSTMLFIYFSAVGIPGCGFFTWLMGFVGDHYGLQGSFFVIPLTMALFATLIILETRTPLRKTPAKT